MPEGPVRITDWIQLALRSHSGADSMVNTFNFRGTGAYENPVNLTNAVSNWWSHNGPYIQAYTSTSVDFDEIEARVLDPIRANTVITYTLPGTPTGTRTGPIEPGNVALAIKRASALSGRRNRGRFFAGRFSEDDILGNQISAALSALLLAAATRLMDAVAVSGAGLIPAVASRIGHTLVDIISTSFDQNVDSMRRRLTGRGR